MDCSTWGLVSVRTAPLPDSDVGNGDPGVRRESLLARGFRWDEPDERRHGVLPGVVNTPGVESRGRTRRVRPLHR